MDVSGAGRWFPNLVLHDASGTGRSVQTVLEDTEAALRKSAHRLRECGQEDGARQAERFAAWTRFDLDEPVVAQVVPGGGQAAGHPSAWAAGRPGA